MIRVGYFSLVMGALMAGDLHAADETPVQIDLSTLKSIDLSGKVREPGESTGGKGVTFVFLSNECPVSNQYITELNRLSAEAAKREMEFYGVISDRTASRAEAAQFATEYKIAFPVLFDATGNIARQFQPTHVPEAFVVDVMGRLKYRGRIDDQFAENLKRRTVVTSHDLADAMAAVCEVQPVANARTTPVGCKLPSTPAAISPGDVTFSRDVAPILYANCTVCHRAGEVAPFELLSYEDAAKRADFIAEVVANRRMPPWTARPGFGHFLGERRLSPYEADVLAAWAKGGAEKGSDDDLPPAPQFSSGWQLGTPDLVLEMNEEHLVPASGPDENRFFVIPIDIPEDKVVIGAEFMPGNPRVVHHAIMYLDRSGQARHRDEATPEPGFEGFVPTFRGGTLGFWAPGYTPRFHPENVGDTLHTGTDLALQLHYHPSGKDEVDRSRVGVYFADKPLANRLGGLALINFDVDIPPGEKRHRMTHTFTTPVPLRVIDIVPHMHLIGTEMKVTATLPDGAVLPLIWSDWDFNWQDVYRFREVVELPAGTRIDVEAYFDNSAENGNNPNHPPRRITFGEETTDEMCICALRCIHDAASADTEALGRSVKESMQQQMKNPKVLLNVTRFMMSGRGVRTPGSRNSEQAPEKPADPSDG